MSMTFVVWNNQKAAEDSLAAVNAAYGCPYVAENGYRMDQWDNLISSRNGTQCGFYKPEERLGKEVDDLMAVLVPGFTEYEEKPIEFHPEPEDEGEE